MLQPISIPRPHQSPATSSRVSVGTDASSSTSRCCSRPGRPHGPKPGTREWSIAICDGIIDLLSVLFDVSSKQLRSASRTTKPVARVRQIGMYIAHVHFSLRMAEVGTGFGRDKSTILYGCHLIEDMRDDPDFDEIVARTERIISAAFAIAGWQSNFDGDRDAG